MKKNCLLSVLEYIPDFRSRFRAVFGVDLRSTSSAKFAPSKLETTLRSGRVCDRWIEGPGDPTRGEQRVGLSID